MNRIFYWVAAIVILGVIAMFSMNMFGRLEKYKQDIQNPEAPATEPAEPVVSTEPAAVPDGSTPAPKFVEPKNAEGMTGDIITPRYVDIKKEGDSTAPTSKPTTEEPDTTSEVKPETTEDAPPTHEPNQKPIISAIQVEQLHLNYEDIPHKYKLIVAAADPDNDLPLTYKWSTDCGFFLGSVLTNPVEWHYNTPGECINAKATVTVTDLRGASTVLTQLLFP